MYSFRFGVGKGTWTFYNSLKLSLLTYFIEGNGDQNLQVASFNRAGMRELCAPSIINVP